MRTALLSLFLVTTVVLSGNAQKVKFEKVVDSTATWSLGDIRLNDESLLIGLVRYDKSTGLLQFKNDEDSRTLKPDAVLSFNFYDSLQQKKRRFISYAFDYMKSRVDSLAQAKGMRPVKISARFFEILMEFPTFAVLLNIGPLDISFEKGNVGGLSLITGAWMATGIRTPATNYSQTESLYIFDNNGYVAPLLYTFHRERDSMVIDGKTTMKYGKMADLIIQRYTGKYFYQVDDYAHANNLSYEEREDILKMFAYYKTLIAR